MISESKRIVYPDLSYEIMAILFKIHNNLGPNFQEKYYQRAIEIELKKQNILFEREKKINLNYDGRPIGRYFVDFVIDNKVALGIKAADYFKRDFLVQVLAYLNSAKVKLGILVNFNSQKLSYRRFFNPRIEE